ncbi:MFS transporter [Bifidobacterium pseudocatenulatum]|uniref:MFS transporter n=1 Tax=Bifidobacterium pseudocatenulatum TaxID=28026 RepID=UPI0034A17EFF
MAILQLRGAALRAKPSISVPLKSTASALAGILLIPLLLPAVPFVLFSVSSFGGVTASVSGQSSYTLSLFNVASVTQYAWALWICFVLFIIATIYIALRETARNMYDPYYAKWENTWKAPVAVMVFWLVAEFLCTNFLAGYSSNTVSTMVPMWYFIVAGVWAFLVEVIAMTFGPTLVASTPGLWKILVGGTVQQTPQNVVDYAKACDPHFGQPKAARTAASAQTTQTAQYNAQYNAQYANPSAPATSPAAQTAPTQAMPAVPMPTTPIPAPAASVPPVPQSTASVPPMPQSPADIPMPAVPQGEGKPLDPKTKKTILIGGIVAGALIVLGIVYGVLNSTVFSAKSMAESYVSAIASGDYDKANDIADPQVGKNQRKLLSNSVAKTDNATISNAHVNGVKSGNGTTTASISYSLNGETVDEELTMRKSGNKFLIFPNWQITTPLIKSINVSVPSSVESLTVNKVAVTAKNAEKTDSGEWQLRVYPGTYNISVTSTDYIVSETVVFRTNEDSDSPTTLKVTTTSKFKDALSTAVNNALDKCAESTDYAPENCPFGFRVWDEDNYRNFAWSISIYPKIDEVDLDYGAFDTKTGKAKCTYEVKDGDSWDPDDDSTTFNASGSFAIKDGKVTVTLDDGGYSY